jgi:TonB-dependent receptor
VSGVENWRAGIFACDEVSLTLSLPYALIPSFPSYLNFTVNYSRNWKPGKNRRNIDIRYQLRHARCLPTQPLFSSLAQHQPYIKSQPKPTMRMRNTNVTLQHIAADATREGTAMKHHPPRSSIALGNSQLCRGFPLQPGLWLAALFLFVFSPFVAHAQQATGDITGRVLNQATGRYLANAVVSVDGTTIRALTDDLGVYRITSLAAGTYTVRAAYIDLDSAASTVTVAVGETATADFNLTSEVYVMEAFTVSGEREGAAKALQDQRYAQSMINVVASDSFGNMVDGNIGELMKKLPGVAIDYSGEDPGAMRIRGMDPSLASITVDGNPIASNGGSTSRAFDLGSFAVQNIEVIELNFAPTPDQPANSMGGSVNFKTRNAFAQKGRRIRIDGNLSLNTSALDFSKTPGGERTPDRKLKPGLMFAYSEAFGEKRPIGISLVANFYQRYRYNNDYTLPSGYTYDPNALLETGGIVNADMQGTISSVQWREAGAASERRNLAINLDWKVSDNTVLFLRTAYTQDIDNGRYEHQFRVNAGTHMEGSNFSNIIGNSSNVAVTNRTINRDTTLWNVNFGAEHKFGNLTIDYDIYASQSQSEPAPSTYFEIQYGLKAINMSVRGVSGNATGEVVQTGGPDYLDISNYSELTLFNNYTWGRDTQMGAKINVKKPLSVFGVPVLVKAGASFNQQGRDNQLHYRQYKMTGNSSLSAFATAAEPTLPQFTDPYYRDSWGGSFNIPIPLWLNTYYVYDYFLANQDKFYRYQTDVESNGRNINQSEYARVKNGDKNTTENTIAGYLMGTVNISKLTVLAGVRYELTQLTGKGYAFDSSADPFASGHMYDTVRELINGDPNPRYQWNVPGSPNYNPFELSDLLFTWKTRKKDYTGIFPNLQLKYEITPNFALRAAYTTSMGRPNYNDVLFAEDTIFDNYNMIRRPNTNLKPQTSDLYQVRLEYYFKKFGSVTLTGFYQPYRNYIYNVVYYEPYFNLANETEEMWKVETKENVGKGRNYGIELSYQQRLGFIASWLDRVEFYAMFSYADPTAKYPKRSGYIETSGEATEEQIEAYMNSELVMTKIPLNNIKKRYAAASLTYKGPRLFASVTANWTAKYARSINLTSLEQTDYAENIRLDLSLGYKLSRHWESYFDWRNFTDVPDERSIFDRTGGYYTSGMVMNVGVRANF